jgi:azurin
MLQSYLPALLSIALVALQATPPAKQATPPAKPAASSGVRTVELTGGDDMKYSLTTIPAKRGETLRIRLVSKGTLPKAAMAHNVVVLKSDGSLIKFANAAAMAPATGYIPQDMKDQIIAATEQAGPGETVETTFKVPDAAGKYPYLCTFPGHFAAGMRGTIEVK